jgi:hypothetical protein
MELSLLNLLVIVILIVLAGSVYSKLNFITPWPSFLVGFCINTLIGYFFVPAGLLVIGQVGNTNIIDMADTALSINLLGLSCCILSFYLFSSYLENVSSRQSTSAKRVAFYDPLLDIKCLYVCSILSLVVSAIILGLMLYAGVIPLFSDNIGSDRTFINRIPETRPIFNFAASLVQPILVFSTLISILKWKELPKLMLVPIGIMCTAVILTGTRSFLSGIFESLIPAAALLWVVGRSRIKISFALFLLYQFAYLLLGGVSGFARDTGIADFFDLLKSNPLSLLVYSLAYSFIGNNFCDLRDFSWILSRFDGIFFEGKTILAGLLSFIPSSVFPFREEFTFARVTNTIIDLPTDTHFGTRASLFGEWYFNFSWFGVLLLGLILGILFAWIQSKYYSFLENCKDGNIQIFTMTVLQFGASSISILGNTSSLYYVYVQGAFLGVLYLYARSRPSTLVNLESSQE